MFAPPSVEPATPASPKSDPPLARRPKRPPVEAEDLSPAAVVGSVHHL
jgi:hypothetical protein